MSLATRSISLLWHFLGRMFERKGVTVLAESCYRNGIAGTGGRAAESAFRLSQLLLAKDSNHEASEVCERGLRIAPNHAKLWCALGASQRRLAQMDAARQSYEKAIALSPDYAQAWSNLGEWWLVRGDFAAALISFEKALRFEPRLLEALNNRAALLYELGKFQEAEIAAKEAIELYPEHAALHVNLGNVLLHTGKARLAVKSFQKALECDASCPEAHWGLATLLGETHRLAETIQHIEHEIAVKGESAQRLASLALAQQAKGDVRAAEATCEKVLEMQPANISALVTLAGCLSARADHRGAIEASKRALAVNPDMPSIFSNIAFNANYLPDICPEEVFEYHREWSGRYEFPKDGKVFSHDKSVNTEGPLRIGYVSGDFGRHPVGFLLQDVVKHHDRHGFRIYCYSMMRNSDVVTEAIRSGADEWVDALFMSDEELAERIHQDGIDILVDLSGHTAYNRLPVFGRRPAPVQATWIGYFHSTGLKSIDYFITDPFTTPRDSAQLFSEIPAYLPHTRFCYSPPAYAPEVAPSPIITREQVTFGCFNRAEKLVEPVIATWARIIQAVPNSRLLLKAGAFDDQEVCTHLHDRFLAYGVKNEQLEFRGQSSHEVMLAEYGDVDIALDPFPFNGGMTTLEALWMGVPIIALSGNSIVSRQTASALSNIGLTELIFGDLDTYISGAVALASDTGRLTGLRKEIRRRMEGSPLCKPAQFSRDLEALYRQMWQSWCEGKEPNGNTFSAASVTRNTVVHIRSDAQVGRKIRLICGTRLAQEQFFRSTALGRSFQVHRAQTPHLELQLFSENSTGLSTIYNEAIAYAEQDPAVLVFIHDDVALVDLFWADQLEMALRTFDIVGIAGNKRRVPGQPAWIFINDKLERDSQEYLSGVIGHGEVLPCRVIDNYGPSKQECKLLDGVMLAADSRTLADAHLAFDPQFEFHFYDMDFCRQAELKSLRMGTWPISIVHASGGEFGGELWQKCYGRYIQKYGE